MKRLLRWIRKYYGISKSEANGFILLVLFMFIIPVAMFLWRAKPLEPLQIDQNKLDSLLLAIEESMSIDTTSFRSERYTRFRKEKPVFQIDREKDIHDYSKYYEKKIVQFDINEADTNQLKQLRGIGSVFSKRILKYRDLLGGFVRVDQLSEVYGLQDSVLMQLDTLVFVASDFSPRMIDINASNANQLSKHPYLKKSVARAISNYRYQHGDFSEPTELRNIRLLDSLTLAKITPYIRF
ncbi:MAG: helix-hairpin-helix domain-containing protein [Bacteroidota bacterium]